MQTTFEGILFGFFIIFDIYATENSTIMSYVRKNASLV